MGATLSTRRAIACVRGFSVCVAVKHAVCIVSDYDTKRLYMYSLLDGSLVHSVGSKGKGRGQFDFDNGGLCMSPDGDSVLVAELYNHRVQEVSILGCAQTSWVRFVGEGVLDGPQYVDCNADVIAVCETTRHCITIMSWTNGSVRARVGKHGHNLGGLNYPKGIRLLADGSGVAVADLYNHRLCVFTLHGDASPAVGSMAQGLSHPQDVVECALDGSFIVANRYDGNLVKLSQSGVKQGLYNTGAHGDLIARATVLDHRCFVLHAGNVLVKQLVELVDNCYRLIWMRACACAI